MSGNYPDCFVWEGRFFKNGSFVVLGESGRIGTVKGICGFGWNFTLRRIEEYEETLDEVPICCMVISACPSSAALSLAHHLVLQFFSSFLGSMLDFLSKRGLEDTLEKDDLTNISATSLNTAISSSKGGVAGNEEYFKVKGN